MVYQVTTDNAANAILDYSKKNNIEVIIMGSRGLGGLKKIKVLGSVSRKVAENSTCSVMLVH